MILLIKNINDSEYKITTKQFKFHYDSINIQIALIELAQIYYLNSIVLLLRYVLFIEHYVVSTILCYHTTFDMSTIIFIQLFRRGIVLL